MLILTTLPILFRQRPSENINSFSYNQSTKLPLAPLIFSSFINGWAVSDVLTALPMYLSPWLHLTCGCWDVQYHCSLLTTSVSAQTVELPLYAPPHLSLTPPHTHFPLATPPLSPCLLKIYHRYSLWGWGREQQHTRQSVCGGQRAACRSEFSPSPFA